jgi:hypothetical protein
MIRMTLLIICCAALAIPGLAQNTLACSPAGTWYGGGDYKYIITITPNGNGSFAMRGEGAYSNAAFGYAGWTTYSGQLVSVSRKQYVGHSVAMFTTSPDQQPPQNSYELDAIRGWAEFAGCDNLNFAYDFYGAYFDLTKIPFIDPPDLNYLPPGGIKETYHRMPIKCPVCGLLSQSTTHMGQKH